MDNVYFKWMLDRIDCREYPVSKYRKLLSFLHEVEFRYILPKDENRYKDALDLRYKWAFEEDIAYERENQFDEDPVSVLEMLVALCFRCEDSIMTDDVYGDRAGEWFWLCIRNLELDNMTNGYFDRKYASEVVERFLDRDFTKDGHGSICRSVEDRLDARDADIWSQMMWNLTSFIYGGAR